MILLHALLHANARAFAPSPALILPQRDHGGGLTLRRAEPPSGAAADPWTYRRPRPPYVPGRIDDPDYVRIFDTTLRDGEQGCACESGE